MSRTTFSELIDSRRLILTEGAVIERLRRDESVTLDPHVLHAGMIYDEAGRAALERIYRSYLDVGREFGMPMIVSPPTWRANPERLTAAGFTENRDVNGDACRFLADIRASYGGYAEHVYIGGLIGCRGDAYDPSSALSEDEAKTFHRWQARSLAAAGVDFLMAATLPAAKEAIGISEAFAEYGLPYVISPVLRAAGTLLDGTSFQRLVEEIDATVSPQPTAYMVNCTHPSNFTAALRIECVRSVTLTERVIGLQANTSELSPEELDGSAALHASSSREFADAMLRVRDEFDMRIFGGCCGTDEEHIRAIAACLRDADL